MGGPVARLQAAGLQYLWQGLTSFGLTNGRFDG